MNKTRRQQLKAWLTKIEALKRELELICSDEENTFENMPEGLQSSMNGMNSEEAIDKMYEAVECIDEAISCIEEIS